MKEEKTPVEEQDVTAEAEDIIEVAFMSIEERYRKGRCGCGRKGVMRIDHGLQAGVHCDKCWKELIAECRSRSW